MKAAILVIREIAEDMPYLMARASNEGRECGQILAKETREALEAVIPALIAAVREKEERAYLANGVADLAMKHRDMAETSANEMKARAAAAEAEVERLRDALMEIAHHECLQRPGEEVPHLRMMKIAARALEGKHD